MEDRSGHKALVIMIAVVIVTWLVVVFLAAYVGGIGDYSPQAPNR